MGFLLSPDLTECHQQVMLISKLQDIALTNWGEVTWRNYLEKTLNILRKLLTYEKRFFVSTITEH